MLPNDDLAAKLAAELDALSADSSERLAQILRGLFACLKDLNQRLNAVEQQQVVARR